MPARRGASRWNVDLGDDQAGLEDDSGPDLEVIDRGRGPLTGMGASPRIRGLIETNSGETWSWRDRRWVLDVMAGTEATHYVYASETDARLSHAWLNPFPKRFLNPFADAVEDRSAVMGLLLRPHHVDLDTRAEATHRALADKVDQVLDIGFELVMLRFEDSPAPVDVQTQVELVNTLWEHIEGRAELVVVPRHLTQTWRTPELDVLSSELAPEVLLAWGGPDPSPTSITASMLQERRDATGGRAPFVWDDHGMNYGTSADRLAVGPYTGRDQKALAGSSGWLRNTPTIARTTVPQLITYSAWLGGRDPLEALAVFGGDLRAFIEGCEGRVPFEHASTTIAALTTPDWIPSTSAAVAWLQEASTAETPHLGSQVRRWRTHLHEEADLCLLTLRCQQLIRPVGTLDQEGNGVASAPAVQEAHMIASILPKLWNDMRRKTTTVMGERFSFAARIAPGRSGAMRVHGPILLEDRNATDLWIRDFYRRLEELPDPHPEVVVECDGTKLELSSDGRFRAPPGRPVVIRWGPFGTTLAPGQELPFTDDGRLHAPGREDR